MFQDLRFGARMLLKQPGLILVATLCLAMGTGANVLMFSLLNAVVLRPVAGVQAPQELAVTLHRNDRNSFDLTSYSDYLDYRARNRSFSGLLAYRATPLNLGGDGGTERIQGAIASGNYFSVLGVGAAVGRTLRAEDDLAPGARPVAVISHGYCGGAALPLIRRSSVKQSTSTRIPSRSSAWRRQVSTGPRREKSSICGCR